MVPVVYIVRILRRANPRWKTVKYMFYINLISTATNRCYLGTRIFTRKEREGVAPLSALHHVNLTNA
jgi:hypothetical protein